MRTQASTAAAWPLRRALNAAGLVAALMLAASCGSSSNVLDDPQLVSRERTSSVGAAMRPAAGLQALVPSNPMMSTAPRTAVPLNSYVQMPDHELSCRRELRKLGVRYTDIAPIDEGGSCQIDWPIRVTGLPSGIDLKPAATLNCQMTLAFATWTRRELAPTARTRFFSGVKTVHQGSSYSCRRIAGTSVASEHSKGNALDIMRIELNNGRDIDVRKPSFFAFREKSLLKNVRSGGCDYFTTVLGPGYNRDHADHFHFDLKGRRNGYVACR
jgi:hypothetical protein